MLVIFYLVISEYIDQIQFVVEILNCGHGIIKIESRQKVLLLWPQYVVEIKKEVNLLNSSIDHFEC